MINDGSNLNGIQAVLSKGLDEGYVCCFLGAVRLFEEALIRDETQNHSWMLDKYARKCCS